MVLPRQRYWDIAAAVPIFEELMLSVGIWRDEWSHEVPERALTKAGPSDYFDIVAASNQSLFRQIVSVLHND